MNKDEAFQAMLAGKKVTHRLFTSDEWVTCINSLIVNEQGFTSKLTDFWISRNTAYWETGWSLFTDSEPILPKVTPMQELLNRLLTNIQEMKESAQLNDMIRGYREAYKTVVNCIESEMIGKERNAIVDAYNQDLYGGLSGQKKYLDGNDYYDCIFGTKS